MHANKWVSQVVNTMAVGLLLKKFVKQQKVNWVFQLLEITRSSSNYQ